MFRYLIRRVVVGLILLWASITIIFLMLHSVPGDPAEQLLARGGGDYSPEAVENVREMLGLDRPLSEQYLTYLFGIVTGDFGTSFTYGTPVSDLLVPRLEVTLEVAGLALLLGSLAGIGIGALAARVRGATDTVLSALLSVGVSVPVYVIGVLFVLIFALTLGWFPAGGFTSINQDPVAHFQQIALPVITISIPLASIVGRMARSSVLENIQQDWVRTAKSWGSAPNQVFGRHVLRNSLTSVTTVVGLEAGTLIGATVLLERVYNIPGIGSLLIDAVTDRDYPVVQAVVIVVCIAFVIINILVDVSYGFLDPRVRRKAA